jgi:hypothetical protein
LSGSLQIGATTFGFVGNLGDENRGTFSAQFVFYSHFRLSFSGASGVNIRTRFVLSSKSGLELRSKKDTLS